jgi:hypothetical protein
MLSGAKHLLFQLRQAEIENLGHTLGRNEDVAWLDVAVDDTFSVRRLQPVGSLYGNAQQFVNW